MKTKALHEKLYFTCQCIFYTIDINFWEKNNYIFPSFSVQTITYTFYIVFWSKQKSYEAMTSIIITRFSDSAFIHVVDVTCL